MDGRQLEKLKKHVAIDKDLDSAVQPDDRRNQVIGKLLKLKPGETVTLQQMA